MKDTLNNAEYKIFLNGLINYRTNLNFDELTIALDQVFSKNYAVRFLLAGLETYINTNHKKLFEEYYNKMR